jgi:hypothetical protein
LAELKKSYSTNRGFDILKFRPDSFRYYIFSRFNKIAEANTEEAVYTETALIELKNTVAYSPFVTQDFFVSNIKETENLIYEMSSIDTSPGIKTTAGDVLNKSLAQFENLFNMFKTKNFGTTKVDYYEILNQIDAFMDMFASEYQKKLNTINYDILNPDLKTNYIIQKLLDRRVFHLSKIISAVKSEAANDKNYVFQ